MNLKNHFDAVVMLTWSDWKTEPRSNRYHYAIRFAQSLPVLFLQHNYRSRDKVLVENTEFDNIDIVNVSSDLRDQDIKHIKLLLAARGIKRPLLWIYDHINYKLLLDALPRAYRVYHATEDYLIYNSSWGQNMDIVKEKLLSFLPQIDLLVACSHLVANSYLTIGKYAGPLKVIENGCDAEYFFEYLDAHQLDASRTTSKAAIFQGGINARLDYVLISDLVRRMPDWEFRFCGKAVECKAWKDLLLQPNVRYLGEIKTEELARHMIESTVGIIPYIQNQFIKNSYPLKAYEYVACGLPVVTVPIVSLERDIDLFKIASTAENFVDSILSVSKTRFDPASLQVRRNAALANSYNNRFASMCAALLESKAAPSIDKKNFNVAILYDNMISLHVSTIREHLEAFNKYSQYEVTFIPATTEFWKRPADKVQKLIDLSVFDVAIIHYSVRLSTREHLEEGLAKAFEHFNGLKVLFIQDEYEGTEIARAWMDRLSFDIIYTCVPQDSLNIVYPPSRFPATEFLPTLTGYVPEDITLERHSRKFEERDLLIFYRGRKLSPLYGELGLEKAQIGEKMKAIAGMRGLQVDIEIDDAKRIYGSAWYKFLGSARATLGTESGANVFDFDGSLKMKIQQLTANNPQITFEEISTQVLASHDGHVRMNQISPKIFEAIRLRTALILFEGAYSGVVLPNLHYIPLKKDFSNIDEVLTKIQDDQFLHDLTERAYNDIVTSGKFSYRTFVEGIDADIKCRLITRRTKGTFIRNMLLISQDGSLKEILPALPVGPVVSLYSLGHKTSSKEIATLSNVYQLTKWVWAYLTAASVWMGKNIHRIARGAWHRLPLFIRIRLRPFVLLILIYLKKIGS
jgi:hypothetical protein